MSSITALPPELLLEVFGYLPREELLDNIQNVCTLWRDIVHRPSLWENFVYHSNYFIRFEEAIRFLEKCPILKHINAYIGNYVETFGPDDFISAVVKNCSDINTFSVEFGNNEFLTVAHIDALFEAFPNIEHFKITINSQNAAEIANRISKCTKLKKLKVKSDDNIGAYIKPIADGCISLEYLNFLCPDIPENYLMYLLEKMKDRLTHLKFTIRDLVTQGKVNILGLFSKLEHLNLNHRKECGKVNFLPLANIRTLKQFEFYSITNNIKHVETIFECLFQQPFPQLQKLSIRIGLCKWGRPVMKDICRCYPKLKLLHIEHNWNADDVKDTFEDIAKLEHLESLVYCGSKFMTDDDAEYIPQCRRLRHLQLEYCIGLTDRTVSHLANCQFLESINLNYCSITGRTLFLFSNRLHRLQKLELFGRNVDRKVMREVAEKIPWVLIMC